MGDITMVDKNSSYADDEDRMLKGINLLITELEGIRKQIGKLKKNENSPVSIYIERSRNLVFVNALPEGLATGVLQQGPETTTIKITDRTNAGKTFLFKKKK